MRIACLYLPGFAIQVERRTNPALCGTPLIIGGYHHEIGRVRQVSEEAVAYGLVEEMPLRQAYSLCPSGVFLPYREESYREAYSVVISQVGQLCPLVESGSLGHILMGLRYERDERQFVEEVISAVQQHTGFHMSGGIALSRFAARLAAEETPESQVLVLDDDCELPFLHKLPVERLPVSSATARRLHLFGISRAGDLLQLPSGALEAQFGSEGQKILDLVRGVDTRGVEQWKGAHEVVQAKDFDTPVGYGGELLDAVHEMIASLCGELRVRWQCCRRLTIVLCLENSEMRYEVFHFKEPTVSQVTMERRIMSCVERLVGVMSVTELRLTASELCAEAGRQSSFLDGSRRSAAQFAEAVGVLQQRYGRDVVKKVATRRGGRLPEEQFSFVSCELEER